jgi:peptide/nickel transport system permease protein
MTGSLYDVDLLQGEYLALHNLVLPAITLGIRPLAIVVQLTRNTMLDVLSQDYIRTARAKGLTERRVVWRHALRNALNPVVTAVSGWFASMLAGAVFIEFIFNWKGLGLQVFQSLQNDDFPVVMGAVLVIAATFVVINILVDILYGVLDPRVRLS